MAELQEALDDHGNPTGELLPKTEIFKRGLWRRVVHIWLVNSEGQLVVQQRAANIGIFDSLWDVSVGGGVRAHEEPLAAAARELDEELGVRVRPNSFVSLGRYKLPKIVPETGEAMNDFSHSYMLLKDVDVADLALQTAEVSAVKKMQIKELIAQVTHDETAGDWVPHGADYYRAAGNRCLEILGLQ